MPLSSWGLHSSREETINKLKGAILMELASDLLQRWRGDFFPVTSRKTCLGSSKRTKRMGRPSGFHTKLEFYCSSFWPHVKHIQTPNLPVIIDHSHRLQPRKHSCGHVGQLQELFAYWLERKGSIVHHNICPLFLSVAFPKAREGPVFWNSKATERPLFPTPADPL